jgi:hypothetical protein
VRNELHVTQFTSEISLVDHIVVGEGARVFNTQRERKNSNKIFNLNTCSKETVLTIRGGSNNNNSQRKKKK